ncbi:MAG TPA: DUF58 domain-containing protein [Burkholderiales bacterium]|jgi:uncharacterized protein (DUF58 family)|nr:DUF58 domain-containing protein [Burkholderiales bacterium]
MNRTRWLLPSPRLLAAVAGLLAAGIVASIFPPLAGPWTALLALAAAVALADAALVTRVPSPAARRAVAGSLSLGVAQEVALRLANQGRSTLRMAVHDHHPEALESELLPQRVALAPGRFAELTYRVRPVRRGDFRFGGIELRLASPLGLWEATRYVGAENPVRVYPNFRAIARYTLLATDNRLSQIGILQARRRGEGLEFHQLREYRQGDSLRSIDWKATSRTGRLIAREYQDERDQRILLLIDCGRRMGAKDGDLSHFDHVLNAALLLAHVGLRQGDAVGVLAMSGEPRYLAPRKSVATIHSILNRVYDLEPTPLTSDYQSAAQEVMRRLTRRSLVVLLTNLRDEDDDAILPALKLMGTRHLVVLASLREAILSRALSTRIDSFDRALTHAATADYLRARERAFQRLAGAGAVCLDVEPQVLAIALVNRYLELKRSGRL